MTPLYLASWPVRRANSLRQLRRARWPRLPRPVLSVGNLAFGGRCKTPMTAALAQAAVERGLRPAILSRGYMGAISAQGSPLTLVGLDEQGPCWQRLLTDGHDMAVGPRWSLLSGDEPAWLAATCPGVPVGIHPDRTRSAAAVLARHEVDIFLLDDGFQTILYRDLDLVLLDPREDPPFAHRSLCREDAGALQRAQYTAAILASGDQPPEPARAWPSLVRVAASLRNLDSGELTSPDTLSGVTIATAVGHPQSVVRLARESGLTVCGQVAIRDHGAPSSRQRRGISRREAELLLTEKDAMGWAGRQAPTSSRTVVLSMDLRGSRVLADKLLDALQGTLSP